MSERHVVRLAEVGRQYVHAHLRPREVLAGVTLDVAAGQTLAIVGPSGSGKTTLLNIMGLLDSPTSGRVMFDGQDAAALSAPQQARLRNRRIGFVFQQHHLLPQCTVLENVLVPTLAGGSVSASGQRAEALLERVGLADHMHHRPGELSGGQRQRVAVVRALINEPALLLADEPTGSLDQTSARELAALMLELSAQRNMAMVVATHWTELARQMGTALELQDGRLRPWGA